jgi:hypothetical protein
VGTHEADAAGEGRQATEFEGDDGGVVAGDVVAAAGFGVPGLAFVEALVAGAFEALDEAGGGMKGGGGGLQEIDKALIQLFAHRLLQAAMGGSLQAKRCFDRDQDQDP